METGNEVFNEIFGHKLTDTRDKARIDDLGRQTVVDGGTVPRFRSTSILNLMDAARPSQALMKNSDNWF
jgi:hypothetical protein